MNAAELRTVITLAKTYNIKLFSLEVSAKDFKDLKSDLIVPLTSAESVGWKPNEFLFNGVRIIGKFCDCGAHPEDWE